jgi:ubiquinone/menaquinone biosynthesis C-methylase UbiE
MNTSSNDENQFDQLAATWDENPVIIEMTRAVSLKIMETIDLNKKMKALEFGCGTGLVTIHLASRLGHITAVDSSDNMLAELNRKIETAGVKNITGIKIDMEKDTLQENDFDFIYSNMTFHHISNSGALLDILYAKLSPGGILAFSDLDTEDGTFHIDVPDVRHLGFSRGAIVSALETAGFRSCSIQDAHVVQKKNSKGIIASFPMFLATGKKI